MFLENFQAEKKGAIEADFISLTFSHYASKA
jgi:hypothetical protein